MKIIVPPIVFKPEPSKDAEAGWKSLHKRIFSIALERLEAELAKEESNKSYPQLS